MSTFPMWRTVFSQRSRLVGILAITQLIGWGTSFDMLAVLGRPMAQSLNLPNEIVFLGLTMMMLVGGLAGPMIGRLLARHGAAYVLATGSGLFAVGIALLALSFEPISFFIAWFVIGVAGGLGLSVPAYAAVVERETGDAKSTIGILMIFTGLSGAIFWPVMAWLDQLLGWREALWIAAGLNLVICLPLHLFALPAPQSLEVLAAASKAHEPGTLSHRNGILAFLYIAIATSILTFVTFGLSPSLIELLHRSGASPQLALQLGSLRSVLGITARLADILLGKRSTPLTSAIASALMIVAGFLVLGAGDGSTLSLAIFVALYGFGSGVAALARALLPLSFFSAADYGRQASRLAMPQNLANAAAPVIYTALIDRSGPTVLLIASGALLGVALLCLLMLAGIARRREAMVSA